MLPKIGVDIVYIPKLAEKLENEAFSKKVFHPSELDNQKESIAGIFAAKEALFKALGRKINWLDIEIKKESSGKPIIKLTNELKQKVEQTELSISHEKDYAMAAVILK